MKVLLLTNHLRRGGISTYTVNLARGLEREGIEVVVASEGGDEAGRVKRHFPVSLRTKFIFSPRLIGPYFKLRKLVRHERVDIVHANTRITQFLAFLLKISTGVKTVSAFHGFYRPHLFRRWLKLEGDLNIAVSREVKKHLSQDMGFKPENIRVVSEGIDVERWARKKDKAAAQQKLGLKGYPLVGIIARLAPEKQHLLLLEAFSLLLSDYPEAKLVIAGRGKEEEKIKKKIKEKGLKGKVYLLPGAPAGEVLESLDIFILPSLKEGFGLSILEAQAKEVPVVCAYTGGMKDIVEEDESGVFFYRNTPQALKESILKLLQDRHFYGKITARAKKVLEEKFSYIKMARHTLSVYNEVLQKEGQNEKV